MQHPFVPATLVFCFSYVVACVFISVFDTSANTILQCYLVDVDIARQHNLEPTHIPKKLAKFLEVHSNKGKTVSATKGDQTKANLLD